MPHDVAAGLDQGGNVEWLFDDPKFTCLDLRHIEDVVDDVQQVLAAFMDEPCIVAVARFAERAKQLAVDDLGEADHGVEWGAQLMAHIGEELRLGAAGALGLVTGAQDLGLLRLPIGDVSRDSDNAGSIEDAALRGLHRPAPHLDPDIARRFGWAGPAYSELDRNRLVVGK